MSMAESVIGFFNMRLQDCWLGTVVPNGSCMDLGLGFILVAGLSTPGDDVVGCNTNQEASMLRLEQINIDFEATVQYPGGLMAQPEC